MSRPNPVKHFHYLYPKSNGVIRIRAKSLPHRAVGRRPFVVHELSENGEWIMPPFPEITWVALSTLQYLGCTIVEDK